MKTKTVPSRDGGESSSRSAEKRSAGDEAQTSQQNLRRPPSQTAEQARAAPVRRGWRKPPETVATLAPQTLAVAAAFRGGDDAGPEDMPPVAKTGTRTLILEGTHLPQQDPSPSIKESVCSLVPSSYGAGCRISSWKWVGPEIGVWGGYKVKRNHFLFKVWFRTIFGATF